jgi:hypothetical protein
MSHARNDPCPCGSGEKYKRCCEGAQSSALSPGLLLLVFVILVGTALAVGAVMNMRDQPDPTRVWSEEHGHWHTVQEEEQVPGALPNVPAPQPPGPAPPGKVWSAEHGHWHDAS